MTEHPTSRPLDDARAAARWQLRRADVDPTTAWRTCWSTDDTTRPTGVAPVCPDEGHEPDDASVYDCCPEPVVETESAELAAYLTALLNADRATAEESGTQDVELTIYRAEHDSIVMGLYTTDAAARAHCEADERNSWPTGTNLAFEWIEDEAEGVAELTVVAGQNKESGTGSVVTALSVASKYDGEADE